MDRSSILAAIAAQIGRLGCSDEQLCQALQQRFGKRCLAMLSNAELLYGLEWLSHTIDIASRVSVPNSLKINWYVSLN